jgi:site-specific recombinase XerD
MNQVDQRLWALKHEPEGPLVPYLHAFASALDEQGFKRRVINLQIRLTAYFSQWLHARKIDVEDVTNEHARRFLATRENQASRRRGESAALKRLLCFLEQLGAIHPVPEHNEITPIEKIVTAFTTYLRQERELCDRTLIQYGPFVERFLSVCFGQETVDFTNLQAKDVVGFIKQQAAQLSPPRARVATIALRSFLRYLRYCGEIQLDLAAAVPAVPNWSLTGIPRAITPEHLQAVFAHCPRNTPIGRRDYAILMLLAHLGLRAGEIVSLTLTSIDWTAGSITVVGKKGNQVAVLPLPADVGEAIADYLQHGRPASRSQALFLRACAPIRGLGSATTVTTIVGAAIKRTGIDMPHRGTHQFRHALASDMLRHGATLTEIGEILRHRHTKTTSLYAKVDFAALRPLSLPWPRTEAL